jgi:hypothetical protein
LKTVVAAVAMIGACGAGSGGGGRRSWVPDGDAGQ